MFEAIRAVSAPQQSLLIVSFLHPLIAQACQGETRICRSDQGAESTEGCGRQFSGQYKD
jgi:hypothetical protein